MTDWGLPTIPDARTLRPSAARGPQAAPSPTWGVPQRGYSPQNPYPMVRPWTQQETASYNAMRGAQVAEQGQQQQDFRNALAMYNAMSAPEMAAIQAQQRALVAQRGIDSQSNALQADNLRGGIDAQLAQIGINRQQGLTDVETADRQRVLIDQLFGLQGQRSALQEADLNNALVYLGKNRDLALQGNDISLKGLIQQALQDRRGARSDATVRGAYASQGHNQVQGDINVGEQLGKDKLANERTGIQTSYEESSAKVQSDLRQLYLDRDEAALNHNEQVAAIEDRRKALFYEAQKYGLTEDELRRQLDNGLAQLALDRQTSANKLMSAIAENNARQAAAANQIVQQALIAAQQAGASRAASGVPAGFTQQQIDFFTQMDNQRRFYEAIAAQQAQAQRNAAQQRNMARKVR